MQPETELIRKAAEAMTEIVDLPPVKFPSDIYMQLAEAALKVFYEHTRGQARERKPPNCPDCGQIMNPGETHRGVWFCQSCGRSQ